MRTNELRYNYWLDSSAIKADLKGESIKGGISTSTNQIINFFLNLLATFILARILLPSDFGLVGMVTAFTGFANIIQDMGLSTAIIQKEVITQQQVSNLFWINNLICLGVGLLFVVLSPLIVDLYNHDSRIYPIVFSYAAGIAVGGLSIQHNALLNRKMKFAIIAKSHITATLLSVIFGVLAAILGMGFWSIIILNISVNVFYTSLIWISCDWRPFLFRKKQGVRGFLKFGAGISGFNIINYFSRNTDNILIGNSLGPAAVGFYSKAFQLLMLPLNQLRNPLMTVAIPALSALNSDRYRYLNYFKKYVFILAFFSMPVVVCLTVFSNELVLIVLGPQWLESGNIFRGLAIAGFIQPVASSIGLVMISTGNSRKYFIWGCINASITILGFLVGIHWGIMGIVYSLVITTYGLLIPSLFFAFKSTPIKVALFLKEISLPFLHTLFFGIILVLGKAILCNFLAPIEIFILMAPFGIAVYYFSWKSYLTGRKKIGTIEEIILIVANKLAGKSSVLRKVFK